MCRLSDKVASDAVRWQEDKSALQQQQNKAIFKKTVVVESVVSNKETQTKWTDR